MNAKKTIEAFQVCENYVKSQHPEATPVRLPPEARHKEVSAIELSSHIIFMCQEGVNLIRVGRTEKAMRWIGFVQCYIWMTYGCSIAALKDMNRSDEM